MATRAKYSCLEKPMDKGAWQAVVHGAVRVTVLEIHGSVVQVS